MSYRIREVDATDDDTADILKELHELTFLDVAPIPDFDKGHWWLARLDKHPVAFAGVVQSIFKDAFYFSRVGVLPGHRGHGLQLRLMRALETKAYRLGAKRVVSDTTNNIPSANNFIAAGYWMFEPETRWSFQHSLYWEKWL